MGIIDSVGILFIVTSILFSLYIIPFAILILINKIIKIYMDHKYNV